MKLLLRLTGIVCHQNLYYSFDLEYFYRLIINANKIRHISKVLGCLRRHSLSKANDTENYFKEFEIIKKIHNFKRGHIILKLAEKIFRALYCL